MKAQSTFTEEEIKARFKPITVSLTEWPLGPSVKKVLEENKSVSGDVAYIVELQDSQVIKVSEGNLSKRYLNLIQQFHKSKQGSTDITEQDSTDKVIPTKRSSSPAKKQQTRSSKRIKKADDVEILDSNKQQNDMESGSDYSQESEVDESDSDEEDSDDSGAEVPAEESTRTLRGRTSSKPKSFAAEYHANMYTLREKPNKTHFGPVHEIPLYKDESFINHHSKYCFFCYRRGDINGTTGDKTAVYIGRDNRRTRLLLCDHCSFSFHNDCVTLFSTSFDEETGDLKCQKCVRNTKCFRCKKDTQKKGTIPFRCFTCARSFHEDCIISSISPALRDTVDKSDILDIYKSGQCVECTTYSGKPIEAVLTEREENGMVECFIKWKDLSYRKAEWVSADWVLQTSPTMYKGYLKRKEKGKVMPYTEVWLMIDRILDVKWENKAKRIAKQVLAVNKDREYAEACWDEPPAKEETALYAEYQKALKRYIQAMDVEPPKNMKALVAQVRSKATSESYEKHELKKQPTFVTGGTLMKHQMEALNWLLYQWERAQSCILADDMGLGKTIQIITFLYYLFKKYKIYPFYIVVPNSTATNWIREFEKWAPELTVAPYYGGAKSKNLALEYEILDRDGRLKCHVVVATYESALDNTLSKIFWPVMIVDESQRLKNDSSILFKHLKKLRVDHTILLTGTPLQNNLRELFNIMHFIHPEAFQGQEAEEYEELTTAQVEELHSRLRPFFLRRTKEEVLKTLPPRYELIVPVTMTTLQKEVYKQCLSGEIQEILTQVTQAKRQAGLTNILMNLRKVLNHPYLLDGVETEQPSEELVQKNMINAGAKLKLFHQMLPKLIERGHRMLIFSTMRRTLDVLEDYLTHEGIKYARIDGHTLERDRVRRIDQFNAADSELKVFLLSTRAGGVGINLATADTVIIWDSDFNPYADLQAIGRAHRIGQNKMVMIYRLMTRYSVEEKVLQIAKKRIALEHVIVERMKEKEDDDLEDIESILKYGTEALFSDDNSKDIIYDTSAIENLLNREQYRATATEQQQKEVEELEGKSNEKGAMNFSFAKVWKSDGTSEEVALETDSSEEQKDTDFWEQFLLDQQALMEKKKEEKRLAELNYGRGARKRAQVKYTEGATVGASQDDTDKDFVVEVSDHDSDDDGSHLPEIMQELGNLGVRQQVVDNSQGQKENAFLPYVAPQPGSSNGQREEVLKPLGTHRFTDDAASNALARKRQQQLMEVERTLKQYAESIFGILITYIDKDIRFIQTQGEQSVADFSFSVDHFNRSVPVLLQHIQTSITTFTINNIANERQIDIQSGMEIMFADSLFEGKRSIILRNVQGTTGYIVREFEKLSRYLVAMANSRDEQRRVQMEELKAEIQKLHEEEKRVKEQHRIEERALEARHRQQILRLANRYKIYPDGIPPEKSTDVDAATDRLISHVLGTSSSNSGQSNLKLPCPAHPAPNSQRFSQAPATGSTQGMISIPGINQNKIVPSIRRDPHTGNKQPINTTLPPIGHSTTDNNQPNTASINQPSMMNNNQLPATSQVQSAPLSNTYYVDLAEPTPSPTSENYTINHTQPTTTTTGQQAVKPSAPNTMNINHMMNNEQRPQPASNP